VCVGSQRTLYNIQRKWEDRTMMIHDKRLKEQTNMEEQLKSYDIYELFILLFITTQMYEMQVVKRLKLQTQL
jgi:hypothetical protein